ncbi:hypothetical protein G7Z17_g4669 [Cylindrodendrum hubeiense]|uniref:Heterokaryon incompatibility domain-containing protein n=1 Tax=Cylindrodendrum hubeiense TaxID=595255 RepID=A0A9P5H8B3_9HYPO|nr:hypothetical protein G7Z17_g4669 [Cylindrodendrum hubeiense]
MSLIYDKPGSQDSAEAFLHVQQCLSACVKDHDCGSTNSTADLPTRLLYVGGSDPQIIRLVATEELKALGTEVDRYVALSYCWGQSNHFVTTLASLSARQSGFALTEMPATMQDAVRVTRALDCRYLWIDALCILQGDDDEARLDWQLESARMQFVYGNSFCTIVAASADDSHGGLFSTESAVTKKFKDEPINSRAWALQEWLLSARLLVYTKEYIVFICSASQWSKYFPAGQSQTSWHRIYKYRLPRQPMQPNIADWFTLVQNYSARDLTNPDDKLSAISGLARRFDSLTNQGNGRYLAGMWELDLYASLLWRHQNGWGAFFACPKRGMAEWYRAPSWSWAANDSIVCDLLVREARKPEAGHRVANIIHCSTDPATSDIFGPLVSGQLTISGPSRLFEATVKDQHTLIARSSRGKISVANCSFDNENAAAVEAIENAESVHLLIMITVKKLPLCGLILVPSEFSNEFYTRVGIFQGIKKTDEYKSWWSETETREYTIL